MPLILILDTGPLSNAAVAPSRRGEPLTPSQQCREWMSACEQAGATLLVPAIAYYEALREIERREARAQRQRLREFAFSQPGRFIPLTTLHLEVAAQRWGEARRGGYPTASSDALDGDLLLVAQVVSLGLSPSDYLVITTNASHLSRYVPCEDWRNIAL